MSKKAILPSYLPFPNNTEKDDEDEFFDFLVDISVECECGAETVYGLDTNLHSTWCKKHKKFKDV